MDRPIFTLATRSAGSVVAGHAQNRFGTEVTVDGEESGLFCFTTQLHGRTALVSGRNETIATPNSGLAVRPGPARRLLISDGNARNNIFLDAAEVEAALERILDQLLPRPLEFTPGLDWSVGLASSLKRQLQFLMLEFQRPDGLASNTLALASMTDLLISLVLNGAPHNYTGVMELRGTQRSRGRAVPAYVRRAEGFMAAHCREPIRMPQVAAAAGCSIRTLGEAFQHFRGKTPLQVLHAIRLEQARRELARGGASASVAQVARRYGFTNAGRFNARYQQLFGQTPLETLSRASPLACAKHRRSHDGHAG